ncbi:helix-turn-helix domain-containing protein [Streptomyces globosus]|uniref:helix-turn-helix domain-containing protein n=1 Tax=Streptomyces globosus TaxID=68209 RepID=UPI00268A798F
MSAQGDGVSDSVGEVAEFAALLRELKGRTDRSYAQLARRLGMNTSTLHRYCAGEAVPLDFAPLERFAALCGATSEQRLDLHRRWMSAVAARRRPRTAGGPGEVPQAGGAPVAESGPVPALPPAPTPAPPPARLPAPRRPWYRRRSLAVGLAAVLAVFGAVGALSALPDGRRAAASGAAAPVAAPTAAGSAAGSAAAGSAEAGGREQPDASPGPGGAAASEPPAGSAVPEPGAPRPSGAASAPPRGGQSDGLPFAWSVNAHGWQFGCGHSYVVAKPPGQVPPPPVPQDGAAWAAAQGAVHGGETYVRLSVQGRSDTAVVLEALRVRVVGRTAPVRGSAYAMDQGCGGAVTPRYFAVDLDKDRPLARAVAGNDAGTPIPAVSMPYRVSAKDPEVLLVTAGTKGCDCLWYLELDWSSQGRQGTVRIDEGGRPFRTSAVAGLPRYAYDTVGRRWEPSR